MKIVRLFRSSFSTAQAQRRHVRRSFHSDEELITPAYLDQIEVPETITSTDPESITLLLSSLINPVSLLNAYQQYRQYVDFNHCILILRILGRFPDVMRHHRFDPKILQQLQSLMQKLNNHLPELNDIGISRNPYEIDLVDVLFSMRKFQTSGLASLGPKHLNAPLFFSLLYKCIDNNKYEGRYLINVYFDLVFLGKNSDKAAKQIEESLQEGKRTDELNFISILTISKAVLQKEFSQRSFDRHLIQEVVRFAERLLDESDLSQSGSLFLDIAKMRWQMMDTHFKMHPIMFRIDKLFRENISRLQEINITQIIEAFCFLPPTYPQTLLKTIYTMLRLTCKQKPEQMRIEFLLKVEQSIINLPANLQDQDVLKEIRLLLPEIEVFEENIQQLEELIIDQKRSDVFRRIPKLINDDASLQYWTKWLTHHQQESVLRDNIEKFFTCTATVYENISVNDMFDDNQLNQHEVKFYAFLLKFFEKYINPNFYFLLIRFQPNTTRELVRLDPNMAGVIFRKLVIYSSGEEFARFLYLLEIFELEHTLQKKDFFNQFQQALFVRSFSNQFVYYMIKYCNLPITHIRVIYNQLVDQQDLETKILLLIIEMFQERNLEQLIQPMIIEQTNLLNTLYRPD